MHGFNTLNTSRLRKAIRYWLPSLLFYLHKAELSQTGSQMEPCPFVLCLFKNYFWTFVCMFEMEMFVYTWDLTDFVCSDELQQKNNCWLDKNKIVCRRKWEHFVAVYQLVRFHWISPFAWMFVATKQKNLCCTFYEYRLYSSTSLSFVKRPL